MPKFCRRSCEISQPDMVAGRDDCLKLLALGGGDPLLKWDMDLATLARVVEARTNPRFRAIKLNSRAARCTDGVYLPW